MAEPFSFLADLWPEPDHFFPDLDSLFREDFADLAVLREALISDLEGVFDFVMVRGEGPKFEKSKVVVVVEDQC